MDAKLKADWVMALRSGAYKQAPHVLRDGPDINPSYCCLGVLCNVMGSTWDGGAPVLDGRMLSDQGDELLSNDTLDQTGLSQSSQSELARMNDDGKPFPEIADYIEENL
jgi:hypothetical protein